MAKEAIPHIMLQSLPELVKVSEDVDLLRT